MKKSQVAWLTSSPLRGLPFLDMRGPNSCSIELDATLPLYQPADRPQQPRWANMQARHSEGAVGTMRRYAYLGSPSSSHLIYNGAAGLKMRINCGHDIIHPSPHIHPSYTPGSGVSLSLLISCRSDLFLCCPRHWPVRSRARLPWRARASALSCLRGRHEWTEARVSMLLLELGVMEIHEGAYLGFPGSVDDVVTSLDGVISRAVSLARHDE